MCSFHKSPLQQFVYICELQNKMDLHLENKIYKNNINVSIQWVQIHVEIFRKENSSHNIHNSHKL